MVPVGECTCRVPVANPSPYHAESCLSCGYLLADRWRSSDENLGAFLDRFTMPDALRLECEVRERSGRDAYGLRYLSADNRREAREEIADGVLYLYLHRLAEIRRGTTVNESAIEDTARSLIEAFAGAERL